MWVQFKLKFFDFNRYKNGWRGRIHFITFCDSNENVIFMSKFSMEACPQMKYELVVQRKEGHNFSYHVPKRPTVEKKIDFGYSKVQRGTRYCWAWGQHSFETNKWTMFLETEASFPYCNWSTKMAGIIWLGSTSVQHVNNWQRLSRLPFLSLCKSRKFLETKTYSFISIEKKIICRKKFQKNLVEIWFA